MKIKTVILGLSILMGVVSLYAENIRMQSDNIKLQKTFQWAVEKSQSFRMTGKKVQANVGENGPTLGYKESVKCIPSYWAGYANRTAFYARDFSRQSLGAHLVGLDEENFSMFKAFAGHCTEDKKWYTWWALNFDGTVYTLDALSSSIPSFKVHLKSHCFQPIFCSPNNVKNPLSLLHI